MQIISSLLILSSSLIVVQVTASSGFTEEQYQLLAPGAKYLAERSPPNQPSVRMTPEEEAALTKKRGIYGGKGDKLHLGGFTLLDPMGLSNNSFNYMLGPLGIKSFIDVGCGKGVSTSYFRERGAKVLCVEGSHDAVMQSWLPSDKVVEHDFSRGPWWPEDTYDAAWSVEFLEHVGRQYMHNYLPVFHKAALIFITSSGFGGWHHVEVHEPWWWKARMAAHGFIYSKDLTNEVRRFAHAGRTKGSNEAQHIIFGMMVFVNPKVANLPKHNHLIAGNGCFGGAIGNQDGGAPCTGVDALPPQYESLLECKLNHKIKSKIWDCRQNPRALALA